MRRGHQVVADVTANLPQAVGQPVTDAHPTQKHGPIDPPQRGLRDHARAPTPVRQRLGHQLLRVGGERGRSGEHPHIEIGVAALPLILRHRRQKRLLERRRCGDQDGMPVVSPAGRHHRQRVFTHARVARAMLLAEQPEHASWRAG
jgi:hypothetical protein